MTWYGVICSGLMMGFVFSQSSTDRGILFFFIWVGLVSVSVWVISFVGCVFSFLCSINETIPIKHKRAFATLSVRYRERKKEEERRREIKKRVSSNSCCVTKWKYVPMHGRSWIQDTVRFLCVKATTNFSLVLSRYGRILVCSFKPWKGRQSMHLVPVRHT